MDVSKPNRPTHCSFPSPLNTPTLSQPAMDVSSLEHGSASSDSMKVKVGHDSAFSNDGAGAGSSAACWAEEVENTKSDYTCEKTLMDMCRSYGIGEEDYRPLCAQGGRGPCCTPPEASNALCVFEAMLLAGVRFPLHPFYNRLLKHFGLAPSQLTPNAWRYLAAFVLLCDVVRVRPTPNVFQHYFKLCANKGNLRGFYHLEPYFNNDRCLFKINRRLPTNDGWKKRFFFLESNKPWGCPKEWGMSRIPEASKPELSEAARKAISKLDAEKAKRDIDLLDLLKSQDKDSFPIHPPPPPPPPQVKVEGSHDVPAATATATATASTHPHPPKRMCLSVSPSLITGGSPPHQQVVAMAPSPPGFPPVPVGSSGAGDDGGGGGELSMSQIVCKLIQDGEAELRHTKQQLLVERAERAHEVSRLQNEVTQLTEKLEKEKDKNMAEARRFTEELETAEADHVKTLGVAAEMREELKALRASQAQLTTKVEQLDREREAAESEHRVKVHNLMEGLQAAKEKHMAMDRQFREDLEAAKCEHTAQVRQLQEAHAAEMNTIRQQYQLKLISAEHMNSTKIGGLLSERYAMGLRDMRDLVLVVCPDVDPALLLTTETLTAANLVQAAPPLEAPVDVDHQ